MKKKFLFSALAAVLCFAACNKDDDDVNEGTDSIDLRSQYCYSLTPGETNDKTLTAPVIEDDIITNYCVDTKAIKGTFLKAKAEKKGGYFYYQFFISPQNETNWIEIGKVTEEKMREENKFYDNYSENFFRGDTYIQKSIILEPETYYNIKLRANYVLNNDTTFADSPTNTFFSYHKDNPMIYIQKYTKNSITLTIDNSIYNHYDSITITVSGMEYLQIKTITKDVNTITFDNLKDNYYNKESNQYISNVYSVNYQLLGDYNHDYTRDHGIYASFLFIPYEEDDNILEYIAVRQKLHNHQA